jgi:hypothetical protein
VEVVSETIRHLSQDSGCPGRDSNRVAPEHKSEALLLERRSMRGNVTYETMSLRQLDQLTSALASLIA